MSELTIHPNISYTTVKDLPIGTWILDENGLWIKSVTIKEYCDDYVHLIRLTDGKSIHVSDFHKVIPVLNAEVKLNF